MKKIISIGIFLFLLMGYGNLEAQQNAQNPRLRNFRYGTGQAQWWENKTPIAHHNPELFTHLPLDITSPFRIILPIIFSVVALLVCIVIDAQ